jgi:hypothetical protein
LQNSQGELAASWTVSKPENDTGALTNEPMAVRSDANADWHLLNGLYEEVHLAVTGWDKVLNDVERALTGKGPIGVTPTPTH